MDNEMKFLSELKSFRNCGTPKKGRDIGNQKEARLVNSQITQARAKLEKLYLVLSAQFESVTPYMLKKAYQGKPVVAVEDREESPKRKPCWEPLPFTSVGLKKKWIIAAGPSGP